MMAATVAALKGENSNEMMLRMLPVAKTHAHPPISNYFVGAVARGSSGTLYLGQNIEIPGNMLGLAVHAEQSAIANAYMAGYDDAGVGGGSADCDDCRASAAGVWAEEFGHEQGRVSGGATEFDPADGIKGCAGFGGAESDLWFVFAL